MGIKIVSSFLFLYVLALPWSIHGTKCYQCYHSTHSSAPNDQNCDEASKIYLRECITAIKISKDLKDFLTEEKYALLSVNNYEKEDLEFSCIVIDVLLYNGKDNLTLRGCAFKHETGFDVNSPISSTFKTHIYICNTDGCNNPHSGFTLKSICKYFIYVKAVLTAAGVVVGAAGLVVAAPAAIGAAGFTASGVAAGSLASGAQAGMGGTVAAGGFFATLQSVGAAGLAASSKLLLGFVGGTTVGRATLWFADILHSKMCS